MGKNYPCDGADGYCPYAEYDNAESMWFCYNHCGVGACDNEMMDEAEEDDCSLEWLSMSQMIEMGVDYEVADYLTSMGMESITRDTETDGIYCGGVLSWNSTEEFVQDVNEHKDEICI